MRGDLAALVVASDLRGVMHMHSTWSDGHASILEMARAAAARGYAFMGISDHSRSAGYAGGLDIDRVQAQRAEIARLNQGESPIPILSGIESDILADGALDYPDDVLAGFDFVIASVHSRFKMDRAEMTARMLRAIASPYVAILAHPSGRLLLDRDPYDVDMEAVIQACARERVAIEINSNPRRLDIDWRHVPHARSAGATFAVNPDAHTPEELDLVTYGIAMARKGGLTAREVLNTWDLGTARAFFRARRPRSG
jgi:DNA polymerase (family 10)